MPYEGEVPLTPMELQARGLIPPGPLSPPMDSKTPLANEQALKDKAQEVVSQIPGVGGPRIGLPGLTPFQSSNVQQVPSGTPTLGFGQGGVPSMGQMMGQNLKREAPNIAAGAAATLVPPLGAAKLAPLAGGLLNAAARTGAAGLAGGGVGAAQGKDFTGEALKAGGGQAFGEGVAGVGQVLGNTVIRNRFAAEQASKIAGLVKQRVPALAKFGDDAKALHSMVYGYEGRAAVSKEFDKALQAGVVKARTDNIRVPISVDDAAKIGLETGGIEGLEEFRGQSAKNIRAMLPSMPAGDVAEKIVGWWKTDPAMYRRVTSELDRAGIGDPGARAAYKYYSGFSDYMDKTKALANEQFWPERAMGGALATGKGGLGDTKQVNELRRRGMGDMMETLRGPGNAPMTSRSIGPWERRLVGGAVGEGLGFLSGQGPGIGGLGGAGLGEVVIPRHIYHNTPLTPGVQSGVQGGATFLGDLAREFFATSS